MAVTCVSPAGDAADSCGEARVPILNLRFHRQIHLLLRLFQIGFQDIVGLHRLSGPGLGEPNQQADRRSAGKQQRHQYPPVLFSAVFGGHAALSPFLQDNSEDHQQQKCGCRRNHPAHTEGRRRGHRDLHLRSRGFKRKVAAHGFCRNCAPASVPQKVDGCILLSGQVADGVAFQPVGGDGNMPLLQQGLILRFRERRCAGGGHKAVPVLKLPLNKEHRLTVRPGLGGVQSGNVRIIRRFHHGIEPQVRQVGSAPLRIAPLPLRKLRENRSVKGIPVMKGYGFEGLPVCHE